MWNNSRPGGVARPRPSSMNVRATRKGCWRRPWPPSKRRRRAEMPRHPLLVILFLSDTHGGRVHDLRIAEATPYPLPAGSGLLQDLGFLAFTLPEVAILMPTKKPRGAELPLEQQR